MTKRILKTMKHHLVARPLSFESRLHHRWVGLRAADIRAAGRDAPFPHRTAPLQIRITSANPHQIRTSQAGPAPTRSRRKCHSLQSAQYAPNPHHFRKSTPNPHQPGRPRTNEISSKVSYFAVCGMDHMTFILHERACTCTLVDATISPSRSEGDESPA